MNILGLVFSLLLILSYGFYACWDKQTASSRLRTTYVGHEKANRKILNSYQSELYRQFRGKGNPAQENKSKNKSILDKLGNPQPNRECAKLNIWPLIQEGRDAHPLLYELTAKMIRTFYGSQYKEKRFEYHFLDALLAAAKSTEQELPQFALEKIAFDDPALQRIYYKMLKGTKEWDLKQRQGYPSLLDYIKSAPAPEKLCLFHAHPDLITVLFNLKVAAKLYDEIHRQDGPLLTKELIERICAETHQIGLDQDLFALLELGHPDHEEFKKTFIAQDEKTHVILRKNIYLKN